MPGTNPPGRQAWLTEIAALKRQVAALQGQQNRPVTWLPLPLAANWSNYSPVSNVFTNAQYALDSGFVVVRGLIQKSSAWASGELVATLPAGSRPAAGPNNQEMFLGDGADAGAGHVIFRIDVFADGTLHLEDAAPQVATPSTVSYLSLSGIRFPLGG